MKRIYIVVFFAFIIVIFLYLPNIIVRPLEIKGIQPPGVSIISDEAERITLSGKIIKKKQVNPRILGGSNRFINNTPYNYRVRKISYRIDYSDIENNEGVETDFALTIIPDERNVSLTSGEELVSTHEYQVGNKKKARWKNVNIPSGGFVFPVGGKLSFGSTSCIFVISDKDEMDVLQDKEIDNEDDLSVYYKIELVRSDKVTENKIVSYRSPYRDRSYVAHQARKYAPHTSYKNITDKQVEVYGFGVFLSNLTSFEPSNHKLEVFVNNKKVFNKILPSHRQTESSDALPLILPYKISLNPGDVITAKGKIAVDFALVFDFAAFIIGDVGLQHVNEEIEIVKLDLNNDTFIDYIDLDSEGSLWVSLSLGVEGFQDTQDEWIRNLPYGKLKKMDINEDGIVDLRITNDSGFCLNLLSNLLTTEFEPCYCDYKLDLSKDNQYIWGDFNGDKQLDLLTIDHSLLQYYVMLGAVNKMKEPKTWIKGYGRVDKIFVSDTNNDGMDDVYVEWYENNKKYCSIWISTGTSFEKRECDSLN